MAETAWQEAWVEVLPDLSNFRQKAIPGITRHLSDAGDIGGSDASRTFGSSFAGGIGRVGGVIAGAVAALGIGYMVGSAVREGLDYISEGVSLASDLSESVNAVQVSYGEAADEIFRLGEDSASSLALTRAELNASAVQFSNFSKTIAGEGGNAAATFENIAQRGVDFASVLNLEVADSLALFQSGLAGETEPLRKYGIDLSAAAVQNYALAAGIGAGNKELSEAEKVQARYGLLMQQTDKYAGDFANTSDGLANSQRTLNASLEEVQTSAGEIFLPLMTELANVANAELVPALQDVVAESGPELAQAFAESVPALVEFAQAVIPLIPELTKWGSEALPLVIEAGNVLLPILSFLTTETVSWLTAVSGLFSFISGDSTLEELDAALLSTGGFFRFLLDASIGALNGIMNWSTGVQNFSTSAASWLGSKVSEMVGFVQSLPQRAVDAIGDVGDRLFGSGRALIGGFIDGISSMLKPAGDAVAGVLGWVQGFFPNSPAKRGPLAGAGWNNLARSGEAVMTQFSSGFARPDLTGALTPVLGSVPAAVSVPMFGSESVGAGKTVNQYVTMQPIDPRLQARQLGRETERVFASS